MGLHYNGQVIRRKMGSKTVTYLYVCIPWSTLKIVFRWSFSSRWMFYGGKLDVVVPSGLGCCLHQIGEH